MSKNYYFHYQYPYIIPAENEKEARAKFKDSMEDFFLDDRWYDIQEDTAWEIEKIEDNTYK